MQPLTSLGRSNEHSVNVCMRSRPRNVIHKYLAPPHRWR